MGGAPPGARASRPPRSGRSPAPLPGPIDPKRRFSSPSALTEAAPAGRVDRGGGERMRAGRPRSRGGIRLASQASDRRAPLAAHRLLVLFIRPYGSVVSLSYDPPRRVAAELPCHGRQSQPGRVVDRRTGERMPSRRKVVAKLGGFGRGEMGKRRQQCGEFLKPFPLRKGTEFRHGFIATHEHKAFAATENAVDVIREVTSCVSNREHLRHQRASMKT